MSYLIGEQLSGGYGRVQISSETVQFLLIKARLRLWLVLTVLENRRR